MGAEFYKLSRKLAESGYQDASVRTRSFARDLERDQLIPRRLNQQIYSSMPDLSYMLSVEDIEAPKGNFGEQIRFYRKRLGLSMGMFGELIDSHSSTMSRVEAGKYKPDDAIFPLRVIERLRLGRMQAESLIEAAGFSPQLIEIVLRHQTG